MVEDEVFNLSQYILFTIFMFVLCLYVCFLNVPLINRLMVFSCKANALLLVSSEYL